MTAQARGQEYGQGAYTRRGALALVLATLAGSTARPLMHAPAAHPAAKKPAPPLKSWPTLDALAARMVDTRLTPGLSLSVAHKGTLLYSKGFGLANIDSGEAVTPQTGFRIASITKQFTAAAILLLAEEGKLSVDDPLSRFLPDFPRSADFTLRQMLSHTSGLGDYVNGQSLEILDQARQRDYSSDDLLRIIGSRTPVLRYAPGTTWAYSNSGFALLGIVVEKRSGMAFADFCEKRLFTPAGLAHTAIDRSCLSPTSGTGAACSGYRPDFRAPKKFDLNPPVSPSFIGGAGAIRSTTEDLVLWHAALLDGKILKPASLNAMLTPALLKNGTPAMEHRGVEPLEYGFGMGLGKLSLSKLDEVRFASHGGRVNGFTGHLRSFPDEKLTVAILYNSDGGGAPGFSASQKGLRTEATRLGMAELGLA